MLFKGIFTAVITPFKNGQFDEEKFEAQIERQVTAGVDGVVPCGTTGESPTLNYAEHNQVVETAVRFVAKRIKVLAGTGSNSTAEAIELTKEAEDAGADGSLQVVPYYNKPSPYGLVAHFSAIAKATKLPIILYNIPGRTGIDMTAETVCRIISECPNVVGIKEASGSCERVRELRQRCPEEFSILAGDDGMIIPFVALGANGVVSVLSNFMPIFTKRIMEEALSGDYTTARRLNDEVSDFVRSLFSEGNPVGIKKAMEIVGLDSGELRLPLVPGSSSLKEKLFPFASEFQKWEHLCGSV